MGVNENNLINSVDRALRILDLFSERDTELKLTEIGQQLNLHKSTVHGLLRTLSHHGYISQNMENGKYRLGMKLVERSNIALQAMDIRRIAQPYLREVAHELGDTTHLVILEGDEAVYIDKVEGERSILQYSRVGKRAPLYCTAVGKVLVSHKESTEIKRLAMKQSYEIHTESTIANPLQFEEEIEKVREKGYGVDDEELQIGLRCLAVPIYNYDGKIIASISVSGSSNRLSRENEQEVITYLKDKALQISYQLGYKAF